MTSEQEGLIGKRISRLNARRFVVGRDAIPTIYNCLEWCMRRFAFAPSARENRAIDTSRAKALDGVVHVMTGRELSKICTPWQVVLRTSCLCA